MTLLNSAELENFFARPAAAALALPDLLLEDLERGQDFAINLASGRLPERRGVIHIPGWDDVLHVVPEYLLPEQEQVRRRRERAIRISESPVPESVQAIGTLMTFVDDVQDSLLTAAILARLAAVFYKPLLPAAAGLGALAEAINVFNLSSQLAAVPLTGKYRAQSATRGILGAQVVRGLRNVRLQRAIPTVGEALQILQATDQWFGVGISLGPLVGLIVETIFGLPQGADFAFSSGIRYRPADAVWLQPSYQQRAERLELHAPIHQLTRAAGAASWVLGAEHGPTFSDRVDALVLLNITAELARGFLPEARWQDLVLPSLGRAIAPTTQIKPRIQISVYTAGRDPIATETFPIPGNPRELSVPDQAAALLKCGPACVNRWLGEAPSKEARLFAEALATDLPFRMIRAFEGPDAGFETHGTPEWRAVIDSLELGLRPPPGARSETNQAYLQEAAILYKNQADRKIPTRDLQALHRKHYPPT